MPHSAHATRILTVVSMLCATVGAGCASSPARPTSLPLGQPFDLRVGASAPVEGALTVTFTRVLSDSRCPMDALCVWAGEAIVAVSVSHRTAGPAERELRTEAPGSEASFLNYSIRLITLQPFPRSDRTIRQEDYLATFTVTTR
jgi:hypothetical protein